MQEWHEDLKQVDVFGMVPQFLIISGKRALLLMLKHPTDNFMGYITRITFFQFIEILEMSKNPKNHIQSTQDLRVLTYFLHTYYDSPISFVARIKMQ